MRKVWMAAMALFLSAALAGCAIEVTVPSGSNAGKEPAETTEKAEAAGVGDTVNGEKWSISLQSAKLYDEIVINEYMSDEPDEGKQYLVLFFEVENTSDEDDYFNYLNIESYVDGYNQSQSLLMSEPDGYKWLTGDVAAGKKLKGFLAWEVEPEWKELEMSYKDDLWTGNKAATFVVTPEQITA